MSTCTRLRDFKYWRRRRFWGLLRRWLPEEITDRADGVIMRYRVRSDIGETLYLNGSFERREIALIARILGAKHASELAIFDIGANIGVHSVTLCRLLPQARVVAFEPAPQTRRLLELNVRSNGIADRTLVEEYALSNSVGAAEFFEMEDDAYSSLKDTQRKPFARKFVVSVETLDHYVEKNAIRHLDLVKIDVEGFESEVIEGGRNTLAALKPDLFVEIYGGRNSNPDPARTIGLLTAAGYRAWVVRDGALQPYVQHEDRFYNYYFSVRDVASGLNR